MRDEPAKVVPLRPVSAPSPPEALPAPAPRRARWPWVAALLVVLAALGFVLGRDRIRPADRPVAVGVMDVRAKTEGVPDWMRTLTRDSLNTVLSRVPAVRVFSRQKIDFLREKRGLTEIEASEQLGMTQLLGASVGVAGPQVTLEVEVVDIANGVLRDLSLIHI